jgi:hypothetical protein
MDCTTAIREIENPISAKRPGLLEVLGVLKCGNSLDPLMKPVRGVSLLEKILCQAGLTFIRL